MECELIKNYQHDINSPNPSERQHYELHLPKSTQSPDLIVMKSSVTGGLTSKIDDSQQDALQTSYNRRETPEGFTVAHNPENNSNQLDFISESETSFLSPIPNKHFELGTLTLFQCKPIIENSVRNVKSSSDFLTDINYEKLMINQPKCYTPNVCISQKLSSDSLKKKVYSSSQTLPYFDEKQQIYTCTELDVIPNNHDVLKWDYAGDIASNHLNISRIISHSNLSSYPVNCNDCGNCDVSMTLTWHSSDPYLSPSSRYGYAVRRKYDFTKINSDKNWSESSKKNGFPELSSTVVNHGSFISSPDPEDEAHTLSNPHLLDNNFLRCQSPLNCLDVDILEDLESDEDLVKCNVNTNSSKSSLNDVNVCDNTDIFNLKPTSVNPSQSMTKIQNHADNVLKATKASEKRLRQHLDTLWNTVGKVVNVSETMNSIDDKCLQSEAPEPCCRTTQTFKSNDIDCRTAVNDVSNEANIPANNKDEHKSLENNSVINDLRLPKGFNKEYNDDDDSQLSLHQQHDLFSLQTISVSDDVESDTFQHIQDNKAQKELSVIQQSGCSKDFQQLLSNGFNSNNYSAITTVTPLNENINNEDGFNAELESFRSSIVMDENYETKVNDYKMSVTNEESISNNFLVTAEDKLLSNGMDRQLSNNYPSTLTSGICITTRFPDHKHYTTSNIGSNKLPEYIPSVYSNLSKTDSIPKCRTVFSHMDISSTKQDVVNETKIDKTENRNLQRLSYMPKASTTKEIIDLSCYNLHQKTNRLPLIPHHCHVRSTVTPACNPEVSFNESLANNKRGEGNEITPINVHLTCSKPYLTGNDLKCCSLLTNSIPDDWDTDTVSLLSTDLLDKDIISNNHHTHKSIVVSNNVKCENSQQIKLLTDGFIDKAEINKEVLTEQPSSLDRAHFEVPEMDVQRFDNLDKIKCVDDNEQLTKIRNHEQDQSREGVMHFEVSQPSIHPSSTCVDLNKTLSTFLHYGCHDKHKKHYEHHVYPSSKNMMGVACAALGGISWFQPLHGSYVNGKKSQLIENYSKYKTSKLNGDLKNVLNSLNNNIRSNDRDLHNMSHITNDSDIKSTCEVLHHASTNNHLVSYNDIHLFNNIHYFNSLPFHNEAKDTYSNDSTVKESHEMTKDESQDMECTNHHHNENRMSKTEGKQMNNGKCYSSSHSKITAYEIGDNLDGCTNIQILFRNKMSSWISRCEERQKALRLAKEERRYKKERSIQLSQSIQSTVSNKYSKHSSTSHLIKSCNHHRCYDNHSNCRYFNCSHCSTIQSTLTNRSNCSGYSKTVNSEIDRQPNLITYSGRTSQVSARYDRKKLIQEEYQPKSYHNHKQNQVNIHESKLAQLRVNRLRMKIYAEKILRSVLQGSSSIPFKEI
ncbi:hypothetical protein KSF78_0007739 [Schistosoma japonicum]|nr:hypothetical protein KSF78_0007739 [Schistosoma japonicum]KAH8862183.1 hypothetical protein KSF78_0007739 [Schistosoma japonicum]